MATARKLVQGIYPECYKQIDLARLFHSFGSLNAAETLARPIRRCQDYGDCIYESNCRELLVAFEDVDQPIDVASPTKGRTFNYDGDWANTQHLPLSKVFDHEAEHLRSLYNYWSEIRHDGADLPTIVEIDPLRLNRLAGGKFHIIRKTASGSYRIWRYGNEVTLDEGRNWTGLVVAEHPSRVYAHCLQTDFFEAEMLGAPMMAHVQAKLGNQHRDYDRLILPILGGDEKTFLVGVSF